MSEVSVCDRCGDNGMLAWANVSGHLKRVKLMADDEVLADALFICESCQQDLKKEVERQDYTVLYGLRVKNNV